MVSRTIRTAGVALMSAISVAALGFPAAADQSTSDRIKLRSGSGRLTVSWRIGCRDWKRVSEQHWQFTTWWDPHVRESGQTKYSKVRLSYKHRDFGDTTIEKSVIVDVRRPNAVADPAEFRTGDIYDVWEPDGWGPVMRVAVSQDGRSFKTVHNGPILDCRPPSTS